MRQENINYDYHNGRCFVTNYPLYYTVDDLKFVFGRKGRIHSIDKRGHIAFIQYYAGEDADAAVRYFHNMKIDRNKLVCKKAMPLESKAATLNFQKEEKTYDDVFFDDLLSENEKVEKKPIKKGRKTSEERQDWRQMDRENERANKNYFSRYNFHGKVDKGPRGRRHSSRSWEQIQTRKRIREKEGE